MEPTLTETKLLLVPYQGKKMRHDYVIKSIKRRMKSLLHSN